MRERIIYVTVSSTTSEFSDVLILEMNAYFKSVNMNVVINGLSLDDTKRVLLMKFTKSKLSIPEFEEIQSNLRAFFIPKTIAVTFASRKSLPVNIDLYTSIAHDGLTAIQSGVRARQETLKKTLAVYKEIQVCVLGYSIVAVRGCVRASAFLYFIFRYILYGFRNNYRLLRSKQFLIKCVLS